MSKLKIAKSAFIISVIIRLTSFSLSAQRHPDIRYIDLAGLVVNAKTLLPVASAKIFDVEQHTLLGATDKNGYFKVRINYAGPGEITFDLKVSKPGFQPVYQHEHWGDLKGTIRNLMYFGLQGLKSNADPYSAFSGISINSSDLGFDNAAANFEKLRGQRVFNDKLARARAGNENVLIHIDGKPYIIDNTGWIKLKTDTDLVSIDNQQVLTANRLNATISRKRIKWMTPLDTGRAQFGVYTRRAAGAAH